MQEMSNEEIIAATKNRNMILRRELNDMLCELDYFSMDAEAEIVEKMLGVIDSLTARIEMACANVSGIAS